MGRETDILREQRERMKEIRVTPPPAYPPSDPRGEKRKNHPFLSLTRARTSNPSASASPPRA